MVARLKSGASRASLLLLTSLTAVILATAFGCGDDNPAAPKTTAAPQKVLQLDGNGDYVSIPIANHNFDRFTIEARIKVSVYDGNVHYVSLYQAAYLVLGDYSAGPVSTWADGLSPVNAGDASAEPDITPDAWHHLAFSYDGTNQYVLVDGDVVQTAPSTGTVTYDPTAFNQGLVVGARYSKTTQYVTGQMDEIRVWNVYRTPTQIKNNMNKVISAQSGLVGYWNFDDGTAKDLTAYHADGVLTGDAAIVNP